MHHLFRRVLIFFISFVYRGAGEHTCSCRCIWVFVNMEAVTGTFFHCSCLRGGGGVSHTHPEATDSAGLNGQWALESLLPSPYQSIGVINTSHSTQLFTWVLGVQTQVFVLARQVLHSVYSWPLKGFFQLLSTTIKLWNLPVITARSME